MTASARRTAATVACAVAATVLAACGGDTLEPADDAPRAEPSASRSASESGPADARVGPSATLSPSGVPAAELDDWDVGAEVLPRRPDGFGVVRPTPAELRVRRLPTTDLLPPPPDEQFRSRVTRVTTDWARAERLAWAPGCPVALSDLRLLRLTFRGFDGLPHTGRMVVHQRVADDVVGVFRTLYEADYPVEQMEIARKADLDAPPTGDGNVTGAYACRPTRGATTWSAHAYGLAVDVNPFMNPYVNDDLVLPELASAYTRRDWRRPGMIRRGDVVTRAFGDIGWTWGGDFRSVDDPMHFSATGR